MRPEFGTALAPNEISIDGKTAMGKRSKTGVLKRLREVKKQERAAMKRDQVQERRANETTQSDDMVATDDDLAGYGFPVEEEPEEEADPNA